MRYHYPAGSSVIAASLAGAIALRRTYSIRGTAGIARAVRCCGSGSGRRCADRDRRPPRRSDRRSVARAADPDAVRSVPARFPDGRPVHAGYGAAPGTADRARCDDPPPRRSSAIARDVPASRADWRRSATGRDRRTVTGGDAPVRPLQPLEREIGAFRNDLHQSLPHLNRGGHVPLPLDGCRRGSGRRERYGDPRRWRH